MVLALWQSNLFAQASGDLVYTGTSGGSWHTASNWSVSNGSGGYSGMSSAIPTTSNNVWIPAGVIVYPQSGNNTGGSFKFIAKDLHILGTLNCRNSSTDYGTENSQFLGNVYVESTGTVNDAQKWIMGNSTTTGANITVASGGKLYFAAGSRWFFCGADGSNITITNNGNIGAASWAANAGALVTMGGSYNGNVNLTFTGSGTYILQKINADNYSPRCNIIIDRDMTLTANSGNAVYLAKSNSVSSGSNRSFTINSGKTVTLTSGSWFANSASNTSTDCNNNYNINGTLDASAASIYFACPNNAATDSTGQKNKQVINLGANGVLKCGSTIKVEKFYSTQTLAVNVATGGTITYAGTAYQTFPTGNTFSVTASPYSLLGNSNSNVSFTSTSATTLTLNNDLTMGQNLTLGAATTLAGASNLSINGILTLGGKLTNNTGAITLGNNASLSGVSSSNYIDLTNGGSFTRNGVTTASSLFPIGVGSYTPLTLANTTGTPNITTKVKTTIDNAVEDATKIVNLQWSVTGSSASTSDITFQFNGSNKASAFDVASTCDLGNYTSAWTAVNVNTPAGTDPYTVSATGLTIPTTNNLYVIGNTGKVVRLAPTNTTWTGAVDNDWSKSGNWSNGVPDNTLDVVIPTSLATYPVISSSYDIKGLNVASGASITNNGTLNITGADISVNGSLSGNGAYKLSGTVAQAITGTMSVNHLTLNDIYGVTNNGTLIVNTDLTVIAGGISGTAPVYSADLPVTFTGTGTTATGLILSPSSGNVGTLTINGAGTLSLSNAAQVKALALTAGILNNSSNIITVTGSVTRTAGMLISAPVYSGSIPVNYVGTTATNSGYEISPVSGSVSIFTLNGSGVYTVTSPIVSSGDINVASGTMQMSANVSAQNITIAEGAVLNSSIAATTTSRYALTLGNGAAGNDAVLTVNGTLGNSTKWANDGIDIQVSGNAKTFTVNGAASGVIGVSGLRPAVDANSRTLDIVINHDMYLDRDNGGAANIEPTLTLQNGTCVYDRTLTIAAGATVTFRGNCAFHGSKNTNTQADELVNNYASSSANQGNCTYIISGTLDMASSYTSTTFNLNTCSFAGNTQAVLVDVKNGGTLKLANIVKMYTALANQTSAIVAEDGSNVAFNYNGAQTFLATTGGGTVPTLSFYNLTVNNTSGISLANPMTVRGTLTLATGGITGSAVIMGGTTQQTIVPNGYSIDNLTINNAAGVLGAPTVGNTLYVTNGALQDYSNMTNCTIVFNGTTPQTTGTGLATVKNLVVNNASGLTLATAPTITGVLTLTSGKLFLGNNNLIIGSTGSIAAPSNSSYIVTNGSGLLVMNAPAATSTTFPIGTATTFNPVTLNPATASNFYTSVNEGNTPALPTTDATILPAKSLNRTWNITPVTPSATTLTLGYNGSTDANASFDNSGADIALLHNNTSGNWEYVGSGAVTPGIGTTTAKTATLENINSFSPFTIVNPVPGAVYVNGGGGTFSDVFRSKANGNWNGSTTWELYDNTSSTWAATVLSPTSTSTVTISAGDTVTITTQAGVGSLTIEPTAVLKSSVSAYTSTPIVLTIGKASSAIHNNGLFGCAIGSSAGTVGDGISLALASNCASFILNGTGQSGIGNLYTLGGSNNLVAVIDQDVQFRYTTSAAKKTALTLVDPSATAFTGSRTLIVNAGKTVSFLNANSCLHSTTFSSTGSFTEQQGNITYDIQGTLDLKGGNVYITSTTDATSPAQAVKLNIGAAGKLIVGGDFSMCKVQSTQAVFVNIENGGLLDASAAPLSAANFYGPSTNSTSGYGSNYVWVVMGGINSSYSRLCGTGSNTKVFNIAVAPASGDYTSIYGNPVSLSTNSSLFTDVYSTSVAVGNFPANYSYSTNYALNRTWKIEPSKGPNAYPTYMKYGFTGGSVDANSAYSPTYPSYTAWYGTTINAGATDLYMYNNLTSRWAILSFTNNIAPVSGTMGTTWQMNFNPVAGFVAPYYFNLFNMAVPLNCY